MAVKFSLHSLLSLLLLALSPGTCAGVKKNGWVDTASLAGAPSPRVGVRKWDGLGLFSMEMQIQLTLPVGVFVLQWIFSN